MKNFSKSIRGFYATLILMVAMLSITFSATAQTGEPQHKPFINTYDAFSQMWNVSSTNWYFGTVTITPGSGTPTGSNYGQQFDSSTSGGTFDLTTSILTDGYVNDDTAIAQAIPGYGNLTLTSSVLVVSGSPTLTVTPISSSDGFKWAPVVGVTVATVVPTSSVTPTVTKFAVTAPLDRFYALRYDGGGGDDFSAQAYWYFQRTYNISLQK